MIRCQDHLPRYHRNTATCFQIIRINYDMISTLRLKFGRMPNSSRHEVRRIITEAFGSFFVIDPTNLGNLRIRLSNRESDEIARAALNSDKRVFVSTHSPTFVMGCIQSGAPVNIIRLTYRSSVATARVLPSEELLELMHNPLLRSTGVLSGLFYEFVVVTESDADRAFYQKKEEMFGQICFQAHMYHKLVTSL
jgi:hypothetical protein